MRTRVRLLSTALVAGLAGAIALTLWATPGLAQGQEVITKDAPTKAEGEWLTIEVKKSARVSWELDETVSRLTPTYKRDEQKEEELSKEWRKNNKILPGSEYPQFFCFKALQPGKATIVLHRKEVTTRERKTFKYTAEVRSAGRP